ncbi:MAG: hypothetical protein ABL951_06825 [Alphaproteobacteria bacterium]
MKITLQQTIIISALLFGAGAQAAGFATAGNGSQPDPNTTICMGANGSGQAAEPAKESCDAGGKGNLKPSLHRNFS